MKVRVLGCSGAIGAGSRTTSFLIDGHLLVDAGTGVGDLTLDELCAIDHVLVSHSHLDHIVSIPLLADTVIQRRAAPITVHALPHTLEALRSHIFNDVIWPDFTRLPSAEAPALRFAPVYIGQRLTLGGRDVEVLPADHTVPACGFAVEGDAGWWIYSGDTGPNPALWSALGDRHFRMLFIETAFSDAEHELARLSRHHCPSSLARELAAVPEDVPVFLTHAKPAELGGISKEVRAMGGGHRVRHLEAGEVFVI